MEVERGSAEFQDAVGSFITRNFSAFQNGFNPVFEFFDVEGFTNVVICSDLEAAYAVLCLTSGSKENNGYLLIEQ